MDKLTFITKIADSMAWPVAVLIAAIIFRSDIRELFKRIKKWKTGNTEVELFEERAEFLSAKSRRHSRSLTHEIKKAPSLSISDIRSKPRNSILEMTRYLENLIIFTAEALEDKSEHSLDIHAAAKILKEHNIIDTEQEWLLDEALELRNIVAHNRSFTPSKEALGNYMSFLASYMFSIFETSDKLNIHKRDNSNRANDD